MRRLPAVLVTCLLGLVILAGSFSGSATAQKGDKEKKPTLPTYWTKLKLSADQKDKIQKVQIDYNAKIDQLKKEVKKLESEEKQEMFKFLTDSQKEELRKIYVDKSGIDPFSPPKKDVEPKKDTDKK